jgi:hypothetical protein
MGKPKFRLFSRKDGKTFGEHMQDAWNWLKELPAKVKELLPEAEDFVVAIENMAEALQEGKPVNEAVEIALSHIPGTSDEAFYELAKDALERLAIRLRNILEEIKDGVEYAEGGSPAESYGSAKREAAVGLVRLFNSNKPTSLEAGLAAEAATFYTKS